MLMMLADLVLNAKDPADAHDARLLGLQCWLAHALALNEYADRPGRLVLMMLVHLAFNAEGLGSRCS